MDRENLMSAQSPLPLDLPETPEQIEAIQRDRKVAAVERARRAAFWRPKLEHINAAKLDDPEEWAKIPILDKEHLRAMSAEDFYTGFCDFEPTDICEYWRSGGSTGRPLFYPKTWEDIRYNMVGFTRTAIDAFFFRRPAILLMRANSGSLSALNE